MMRREGSRKKDHRDAEKREERETKREIRKKTLITSHKSSFWSVFYRVFMENKFKSLKSRALILKTHL